MPVSSLIVRTVLSKTGEVTQTIEKMKNVSIGRVHQENIIVITDTKSTDEDQNIFESIEEIPGVLQCDLVFHNFEDIKY